MLLSCKISNSILTFLEGQGEDISDLLDMTALPEEFLRDTSYWMPADDMEIFLHHAQKLSQRTQEYNFLQKVGHDGPTLRSWGVLDSVLRMMPRPHEILAQPERFLSYFVSPSPPIDHLKRTENSIEFDLAVSADQYPLSTRYLISSFESLPVYGGQPLASCQWNGIHINIQWSLEQKTMFEGLELDRQISPELMRTVLATLEKHSQALEEKNRELQAKNEALILAQTHFDSNHENTKNSSLPLSTEAMRAPAAVNPVRLPEESFLLLTQNMARLGDYMVRAQQLITMLVAQGRMNSQVKEAMRRVDWERVRTQFPQTIEECQRTLRSSHQQGETHV